MRLLRGKSRRTEVPIDDIVAAERLKSVTGRGRVESGLYPVVEEQPEPERIKRRFWTPDELVGGRFGEAA